MSDYIFVRPKCIIGCGFILIFIHIAASFTNVPTAVQLILNSVCCLYMGCFIAAKIDSKKDKDGKYKKAALGEDIEIMQEKDAMMFPVIGSCILFGIYLLYKFVNKELLSIIFTVHFTFIGVLCLTKLLNIFTKDLVFEKANNIMFDKKFTFNIPFVGKKELDIKFSYNEFNMFLIALVPTYVYGFYRHWLSNNAFGLAFSIIGIENLVLPNFKVGYILMWGLFFYDIFWVYGTDVMVTVAKSFDAPIKLMFPYDWTSEPPKFSMLGLGDIVIPGIFVAMCLKYDIETRLA